MKYTIEGFQQRTLVDLGLDGTDALILRWYVDFKDSGNMAHKSLNGYVYYWISYKALIRDMPILGIKTTKQVSRRLDKMADAGVLRKHVKRSNTGTYSMFAIGEKYAALLDDGAKDINVSCAPDADVSCAQDIDVHPKDSSIKDSSIKNTSPTGDKVNKQSDKSHQQVIDYYYRLHKDKTGDAPTINGKQGKAVQRLLKSHEPEKIMAKLKRYYSVDTWFTSGGRDINLFEANYDRIALPEKRQAESAGKIDVRSLNGVSYD